MWFGKAEMPVLWVNSDHDPHFSLKASTESHNALKNNSVLSIYPDLEHSENAGMNVNDVYNFADSIVKNGADFIRITDIKAQEGVVVIDADIPEGVTVEKVEIYTAEDKELIYRSHLYPSPLETEWILSDAAAVTAGGRITFSIPATAGMYYANIIDNNGNTTSTGLIYNS